MSWGLGEVTADDVRALMAVSGIPRADRTGVSGRPAYPTPDRRC
ncbi:hypothetical protein ATKI12_4510 [Kitasatospora sp. Ki12]